MVCNRLPRRDVVVAHACILEQLSLSSLVRRCNRRLAKTDRVGEAFSNARRSYMKPSESTRTSLANPANFRCCSNKLLAANSRVQQQVEWRTHGRPPNHRDGDGAKGEEEKLVSILRARVQVCNGKLACVSLCPVAHRSFRIANSLEIWSRHTSTLVAISADRIVR